MPLLNITWPCGCVSFSGLAWWPSQLSCSATLSWPFVVFSLWMLLEKSQIPHSVAILQATHFLTDPFSSWNKIVNQIGYLISVLKILTLTEVDNLNSAVIWQLQIQLLQSRFRIRCWYQVKCHPLPPLFSKMATPCVWIYMQVLDHDRCTLH